uniref:Uncharacterized protein n=1 Tax=viral metagenome TaxID=1070528 RepID=A0A6M3ISC1_9ZZZZ
MIDFTQLWRNPENPQLDQPATPPADTTQPSSIQDTLFGTGSTSTGQTLDPAYGNVASGLGYNWAMPNWMPQNTYNWWERNPDPNFGTPEQPWYRSPRFGYEAIYNPYYGWQNIKDVTKLYQGGTDFWDWDLTQQLDPSWAQYGFPQYGPGGAPGSTGTPGASGTGTTYGGWDWPGTYPTEAPEQSEFQYPEEWNIASSVLGNFAQHGYPTDIPGQWTEASDWTSQMMQSGMPTSQDEWYTQRKAVVERDIQDSIKQAAEQARLGGLRWSTPLGRTAQDIAGRTMSNFGVEALERELSSLESAKERQMGTLPYMYQFGAGEAGLAESAKERGLGAAQQLLPLGQARADLPQQLAQTAYSMGTGLYGQQQQGLQSVFSEWLRTQPEYSPWLQNALNLAGVPTGQMAPEQYQPSTLTSLLSVFSSALPFLLWKL